MKEKTWLIRLCFIISLITIIYSTVEFFNGETSYFTDFCLLLCYLFFLLYIVLSIVDMFVEKINVYKLYKYVIFGMTFLEEQKKKRYKAYFSGNKNEIDEATKRITNCANAIIIVGAYLVASGLLNKQKQSKVENIMKKATELLVTESQEK